MATFPQYSTAPSFLSGGNFQTTTNLADPTIRQAYIDNLNFANAVAERPYEQYSGPRVAELNADQQAAFQGVRDLQGAYQPYLNQAQQAIQGAANYQPGIAQTANLGNAYTASAAQIDRSGIQNITPQSFLNGNVGAYMNPYTQQVIDATMSDIDRARQLQQQQINAQAASRGAFGGSRQAIAESENSRNYLDQQARTAAQLRNQGFDTASNLLQNDITRNMQAQQANQGIDYNVASQNAGFNQQNSQFNAGNQNQFALANFNAQNANNQFNVNAGLQGAQLRQGAGQQLAALGGLGQQYGLNAANALNTIGGQQQAQVQANYNTAAQDFQNQFNYPLQQLQIRSAALGVQPYGGDRAMQTPLNQNNLATTLGALATGTGILNNLGLAKPFGNFLGGLGSSALSGLSGLFGSSNNTPGLFTVDGVDLSGR